MRPLHKMGISPNYIYSTGHSCSSFPGFLNPDRVQSSGRARLLTSVAGSIVD